MAADCRPAPQLLALVCMCVCVECSAVQCCSYRVRRLIPVWNNIIDIACTFLGAHAHGECDRAKKNAHTIVWYDWFKCTVQCT